MNNFDEIYNQALQMLKQGASENEVLVKFADHKEELAPLLALSTQLFSIPKSVVPTPLMKRKYASAKLSIWQTWFHLNKVMGIGLSAAMLCATFVVMGYQTSNSAPGEALFAVKKSAENLELALTISQAKKADLQIQIMQNRLNEAQAILSNPESQPEAKTAALTELADQTSKAVAQVDSLANNDPKSDKNHPLLSSLDNLTQQQQKLLSDIKPDTKISPAANDAQQTLNKNAQKISEIKHSVAVAGSTQTLAELSADPNSVAVLGKIKKVEGLQITIEDTTFNITDSTVIKDEDGNTKLIKDLNQGIKVNVTGTKDQTTLLAKEILIINHNGEVKSANINNASGTKQTIVIKKESSDIGSSTNWSIEIETNAAVGSFILEDPSPHFIK